MFGWTVGLKKPKSKVTTKIEKTIKEKEMKYKPHGKQPTPLERKVQSEIARGKREKPPKVTKMASGIIQTEYPDGRVMVTYHTESGDVPVTPGGRIKIPYPTTADKYDPLVWARRGYTTSFEDMARFRQQWEENKEIVDERTANEKWADEWEKKHA